MWPRSKLPDSKSMGSVEYNRTVHLWQPLKMQSAIWLRKRLLIFDLNSQSNNTPPFRGPEAPCWLA